MLKKVIIIAGLVAIAAVISAAESNLPRESEYDYDPPAPGSYSLPVIKMAGDGGVIDSADSSIRLHELTHGRITVLSFIYTRCAAGRACPYATNVLGQIHRISAEDKALTRNMRLVSLSFDPEYDTPERLAFYSKCVRQEKAGCEWRFATAKSRADLEAILAGYGQAVDKRPDAADPQGPLFHTLRVFLIDRDGRVRNIYSSATLDRRLVLADVKTLLLEEEKISKR